MGKKRNTEELTTTQKQILRYITKQIQTNGYAPSVREIGRAVGLSSTATVHCYLKKLEELGYIRKENQKGRTLRVLKKEEDLYNPKRIGKEPSKAFYNKKEMVDVPVVGKILGDTVESVLSCTNVIKNAVGTLGMIGVIFITAVPLIRIGLTTIFLYLISGLAEVVADKKIVYVIEQMGDSCKVLLASMATVVMMLIIGFTITMRIGMTS